MTHEQKIELLTQWRKQYYAIDKKLTSFDELFNDITGPLFDVMWGVFDDYTKALSIVLNDNSGEWLSWYAFECEMGEDAKKAGYDEDIRLIVTLDDLLWLIES